MKFLTLVGHFLLAVLVTFILASVSHSHFVMQRLIEVGVEIDLATRLASTWDDLLGLAPGYAPIIAAALLLGFLIMSTLQRFLSIPSLLVYPLAGVLAIATAHLAMHPIFNVTLIAGARGTAGLLFQCLAGLAGGFVFLQLRSNNDTQDRP